MIEKEKIKCKGFAIISVLKFMEDNFGSESLIKFKDSASEEMRDFLSKKIISSDWYPFEKFVHLLEETDKIFGTSDFKVCKEIGKFNAKYELSTIHMIILKFISIEKILKLGSSLWGRYFSCGNLDVEIISKGNAKAKIFNFNPISKAFCLELSGWMEKVVEVAGAKSAYVIHKNCILDGKEFCEFDASWK